MYQFGKRSKEVYETLHPDLQKIMDEVIKIYDVSLIEGHRSIERQQHLYHLGQSKLDGIHKKSKHNYNPSLAVDLLPYKKGYNAFSGNLDDTKRFYFMAGIIYGIAERLYEEGKITHKIRWGGDWNRDFVYKTGHEFTDLPHIELMNVRKHS